ncbi:bifunctional 2-polyprenyl-6-hydroxyphenol methylase/3-demethylubiquinol 3-O-methyltransferase UbiG [Psychrobium sp. 1_MG-2023]|uniref:class I SAM-dependent methyltransferase n=1 Tax=Psychrobium sp. 1_MG-2023 TaxID=3062624 RepID=UPI000C31FE15|nr:class I SAM-dependent methyltransferase [Psychrobium sp. 1_MG-2023]MDP2562908.1 class I SAM-dependent methyltransferase [Psychrobium sp. 1_MG-2023]PKF54708.1 SAM-dependent methyltransferase [Alteromonadales bacterium alter-6D02]
MDEVKDSTLYYDQNATSFIENTLSVDMSDLYQHFLPLLPCRALILDAGCGSGRDSKFFIDSGYRVTAIDACRELAKSTEKLISQPVQVAYFQNFSSDKKFDAIWACASLLHVPSQELPNVFQRFSNLLKSSGVLYCSFKYGTNDIVRNHRLFVNANQERLQTFIQATPLTIQKVWLTNDQRSSRNQEQWLIAILVKGI